LCDLKATHYSLSWTYQLENRFNLNKNSCWIRVVINSLSDQLRAIETAAEVLDKAVNDLDHCIKGVEMLSERFELPSRLRATQTQLVDTQTKLDELRQSDAGRLQAIVEAAEKAERQTADAENNTLVQSELAKENKKTVQTQIDAAKEQASIPFRSDYPNTESQRPLGSTSNRVSSRHRTHAAPRRRV
jgi:hypothetical protein